MRGNKVLLRFDGLVGFLFLSAHCLLELTHELINRVSHDDDRLALCEKIGQYSLGVGSLVVLGNR